MRDSNSSRTSPQPQALHYSYEKAGQILDNQPIPWNADAVLIEALVALPGRLGTHAREDFALRLSGQDADIPADNLSIENAAAPCRVFFRVPTPLHNCHAEVLWRGKTLGQLNLPILSADNFLSHCSLQHASLHIRLGDETVPGMTLVTGQCQGLLASALVASATSLAPVVDLEFHVEVYDDRGVLVDKVPVRFSSSQLRARQALVTVALPRPRRKGTWHVAWMLQDRLLASHRLKTITKLTFARSLRLSTTRFIVQPRQGPMRVTQGLPDFNHIERLGPCFWVSSSEPSMAGWAELQVHARLADSDRSEPLGRQRVLVSDGPEPVAVGTLPVADLMRIQHFEVRCENRLLGVLPLTAAPTAEFNGEGVFQETESFPWSTVAEQELQTRLNRLLLG